MGKPARKPDDWVPHSNTVRKWCNALGCWTEYKDKREDYKKQGLNAREAKIRVLKEMDLRRKFEELNERKSQSAILGSSVPLTPDEIKEVIPGYKRPGDTPGAKVEDQVMSLPEQIKWVKHAVAKRQNGGAAPKVFPNYDVLYWYQRAVRNQADFDKVVLKMDTPQGDGGDAWLRDGEYQIGEIDAQIRGALEETAHHLVEYEADFAVLLDQANIMLIPGDDEPITKEAEALL